MQVHLFSRAGAVVATVEVEPCAEAILLHGKIYILKDGSFREAVFADRVTVLEPAA